MLTGIVLEASIQDRDGAQGVIGFACESFPAITHIFAGSGYAGEKLETALAKMNGPAIEIVKRPDGAKGFVLVARRWAVDCRASLAMTAPCPGSIAAAGSPRTGRPPSHHPA